MNYVKTFKFDGLAAFKSKAKKAKSNTEKSKFKSEIMAELGRMSRSGMMRK